MTNAGKEHIVTEKLPHWDLSNVYPGLDSPEFREAMAKPGRLPHPVDDVP